MTSKKKPKPCVHSWMYYRSANAEGYRCDYKVCMRCGEVVWFATWGCK